MANQYGQTIIDPRAELLLGRAMRPEPIQSGMGLIGRLAALGVGQQRQRTFEDEIAASRLQYAQALGGAGNDPSARLAALGQGMASRDPVLRAAAAAEVARLSERDTKFVTDPGGGTLAIETVGGQVAGQPQQLVQGRKAEPKVIEVKEGENFVSMLWDADAGTLTPLAEAPRTPQDRPMPADVFGQQIGLRTAAGRAQGEATGAALAGVTDEAAARARGADVVRQEQEAREQARITARATETSTQFRAAVADWKTDPTNAEKASRMGAARQRMTQELAAARSFPRAPTDADWAAAAQAIPDPVSGLAVLGGMQGGDPFDAALRVVEGELGVTTTGGPPVAGQSNLTPAELRRMADLLEKSRAAE